MMAPACCGLLALVATLLLSVVPVGADGDGVLQRHKRNWVLSPRKLYENHDYTGLAFIAKIRSDKDTDRNIFYSLRGPGVDQHPVGIFGVDRETGFVKIYSILDRESIPVYNLKGVAKYADGSPAENDLDLQIKVLDKNDCPPVIEVQQVGSVNESSAIGTVVMTVKASDADEAGTAHSDISYSIVQESNTAGMFSINSHTGQVLVQRNTLDREMKDSYTLTIRVEDMAGQGGNTGTGQITVNILDINDNIPTLEKESYEGSVEENTVNVEVMRIKAIDMDLIHTDSWYAVYQIISGNEAGYFTITTDQKTNEGIITIREPLDYEQLKMLNLEVVVSNKASYNFGSGGGSYPVAPKGYPVRINVVNQKEGPRFHPSVKVVTISEDHTSVFINKVIGNYAAIDSDTLTTATNVKYIKVRDDDNWLVIDGKTADIKLNKLPDRESKFLVNGTYYATIIAIDDSNPAKTATGTIAIQVEDFNDHCPQLTRTEHTMCLEDTVIYVTAVDQDHPPNSAPFQFIVIQGKSTGQWTVEPLNETTALLRDNARLWPGVHRVTLEVRDQQQKSCDDVQLIDVTVCTCDEGKKSCSSHLAKSTTLGAGGILLLLLGLLLLLLLPLLLLFCLCGGVTSGDFKPIPFDTKQQLISYHTEGQGEDKEVPLLQVPVEVDGGFIDTKDVKHGMIGAGAELGGGRFGGFNTSTITAENAHMYNQYNQYSQYNQYGGQAGLDVVEGERRYSQYGAGVFDGMALSDAFLDEYYTSKSSHAAQQSQPKDALLVYDYEGAESLAGSVGCCSLLENESDLDFLDDLGPKFRTLAEICRGSALVTESLDAEVTVSPPGPTYPVWPPTSTHTHVQTHSETIRDREHAANTVNTVNTSNVESSTVVHEQRITERSRGSTSVPAVHVQDQVVMPSSTVLIQQPAMYYTAAAPMYVVEPNPQMVLVAGATQQAVGQVVQVGGLQGSQGLVQVGGLQGGQGLVQVGGLQGGQGLVQVGGLQGGQGLVQVGGLQGGQGLVQVGGLQGGQGLVQVGGLQGGQGVVLVDRQVGVGGARGQVGQGLTQGTLTRSTKVVVVENGSSGFGQGVEVHGQGVEVRGQGSEVRGQGSKVLEVHGQGSKVLEVRGQGLEVRGQGVEVRGQGSEVRGQGSQLQTFSVASGGSAGSSEDFALAAAPKPTGSQRVVVQRKKVSVTERNVESSSRA